MTGLIAAYADEIIVEGFMRFLPIAAVAAAFGFVYWLFRRAASRREEEKRSAWLKDRREKREIEKKEPSERS